MQITIKCPSSVKNSKCVHLVAQAVQHPHPPNLMWDAAGLPCGSQVLCTPCSGEQHEPLSLGADVVTQGTHCIGQPQSHPGWRGNVHWWWQSGNFGWLILKIRDQRCHSPLCPTSTCLWMSSQYWGTWCDAIDLLSGIKTSTFALSLIYVKLFQHRSCLWLFFIAESETTDQDTFCPSRMEGFCNIFIPEIASASMHWTQHICVLPG